MKATIIWAILFLIGIVLNQTMRGIYYDISFLVIGIGAIGTIASLLLMKNKT